MIPLLLLFTISYAAGLLVISLGIGRLKPPAVRGEHPFISVIVAARNEAAHIIALLTALDDQFYPRELYECIIVDDASCDGTSVKVAEWISRHPNSQVSLIHSQERETVISPKKHALAQGIRSAKGEILLFTDADCLPPPSWISSLQDYFTKEIGMVIGYSPYEIPQPRSLGQKFLALESLSLAALAAGTAGWGRPATCTGRNLGYRKNVWSEVNGFSAIANFISGDDDLFLKQVLNQTRWQIAYALNPKTIVPTRLLTSSRAFFRQRLRHASKGLHYGWRMSTILALAWIFNLVLLISAITSLFQTPINPWPWIAWAVKSGAELLLLYRYARPMKRLRMLTVFPQAQLLHLFYVILFGALGPLTRIKWKETSGAVHSTR